MLPSVRLSSAREIAAPRRGFMTSHTVTLILLRHCVAIEGCRSSCWCVHLLDRSVPPRSPPMGADHEDRVLASTHGQPSDPKPSPRRQERTASRAHQAPINTHHLSPHPSSHNSTRRLRFRSSSSTTQIRSSSKSTSRDRWRVRSRPPASPPAARRPGSSSPRAWFV
jgi:hypothetical protein